MAEIMKMNEIVLTKFAFKLQGQKFSETSVKPTEKTENKQNYHRNKNKTKSRKVEVRAGH